MADLTKQALKVDNNTSFPNNNTGYITPSLLRDFNTNMIDSTVNQGGYNSDSASWNSSINQLDAFTASLNTAFVSTGSFNTYTSSINSKFNDLQTTTASMQNSISSLNAYTASDNSAITNLNAFTASQNTKDVTLSNVTASLNAFTASQATINTGYNTFTQSANTQLTNLASSQSIDATKFATIGTQSGSWGAAASPGTISGSAQITALGFVSSSVTASSLVTASFSGNTLTFTKGNGTTFGIIIPDVSGSGVPTGTVSGSAQIVALGFTTTSSFNAYTSSNDTKWSNLATTTASFSSSVNQLNQFTSSQATQNSTLSSVTSSLITSASNAAVSNSIDATKWSTLGTQSGSWITESETGSFAYIDRNNSWSVNQNFTNITAVSASFRYVQTLYETSSVIYSTGSNQFGDALDDIQTLSGSVKIQGGLTINGVDITGSLNNLNSFTSSALTNSASVNSSLTNLNAFTSSQNTKNSTLQTYTASVDSSLTNLNSFTSSQLTINSNLNLSSSKALVTASVNLNTITFTKGDATTFNITVNTGSGGGTSDLTSLNAFTASQETKDLTLASVTSSLNNATASLFTSTSLSLITASFDSGTRNLTFTKGNTTQFSVNIPDASGSTETIYDTVYTGESITKGDTLYISGSQGANPIVYKANAADPLKMPVTYVSNQTIGAGNTTNAIILGHIEGIDLTGYTAGQAIYVAEGGGWSTSLPSGSNSVTQLLGIVTKAGSGGKGLVLNPGPAQLPGLDTGYLWVGGSTNQPVQITSASFATTGSNTFNGNQTISGSLFITSSISVPSINKLTSINTQLVGPTSPYPMEQSTGTIFFVSYGSIPAGFPNIYQANTSGAWTISGSGVNNAVVTNTYQDGSGQYIEAGGATFTAGQSYVLTGPYLADISIDDVLYIKPNDPSIQAGNGYQPYPGFRIAVDTEKNPGNVFAFVAIDNLASGSNYNDNAGFSLNTFGPAGSQPVFSIYGGGNGNNRDGGTDSIFMYGGIISVVKNTQITGSLAVSGSLTASLANGYTWVGNGSNVSTLVATSSFGGGGSPFPYTGNAVITGSLQVTGSVRGNVVSMSVSSNTASVDFNTGNIFTLTLPASATTHIIPTNIKAGQTVNIQISQPSGASTGSVTFPPSVLFAGGYDYQATMTGSAKDVISFIAFDSSNVVATSLKNLL